MSQSIYKSKKKAKLCDKTSGKCGEITFCLQVGTRVYALNCLFCNQICIQWDAFINHMEEEHVEELRSDHLLQQEIEEIHVDTNNSKETTLKQSSLQIMEEFPQSSRMCIRTEFNDGPSADALLDYNDPLGGQQAEKCANITATVKTENYHFVPDQSFESRVLDAATSDQTCDSIDEQVILLMAPLTAAERQRIRKEKLKTDGQYEEYKKKHSLLMKKHTKMKADNISNLPAAVQKELKVVERKKVRERVAKIRMNKNVKQPTENRLNSPSKVYKSTSALGKAVARARRALSNSPRHKKVVVRKLFSSECLESERPRAANSTIKCGDWFEVHYDGKLYPGEIVSITNNKYEINTMVPVGKHWRWPAIEDKIFYERSKLVRKLQPPNVVNSRGRFTFKTQLINI